MVVTDKSISTTARSGDRPDVVRAQTWPESNNDLQEKEGVSIAEYLRGIQNRNILALDLLGQLMKQVSGAVPEPYEPENPDNMTEHVKRIFDEACDIEEQISRLAYALGINI